MKIEIELINSKWVVNGNPFDKMTQLERELLNTFFKEYKKEKKIF